MRALSLLLGIAVVGCGSHSEPSLTWSGPEMPTRGGERVVNASIVPRGEARMFAGEITEADPPFTRPDLRHDRYRVQLDAGDTLRAVMWSIDFDTYLHVLGPDGADVVADDDGTGTLNSFLQMEADTAGVYTVIATHFAGNATGMYAIGIRSGTGEMPEPVGVEYYGDTGLALEPEELAEELANAPVEQTIPGTFSVADPTVPGSEDRHFRDYPIEVQAGETLYLQMRSEQLDSYLTLLGPNGQELESNDDFNGLNSFLVYEAHDTGTFHVRATTYSESEVGDYEVLIGRRAAGTLAP